MSKYCIYWDRPVAEITFDESFGGCTIFGVHHDCEKCPNLIEVGDSSGIAYSEQKTKEE